MTSFEKIYEHFLDLTTEHELSFIDEDLSDQIMKGWLMFAIARFDICKKDLSALTEDKDGFKDDLSCEEIDILANIMVLASIKPKLHNSDLFKNGLSTKDYSMFSPANLLNSIQNVYDQTKKDVNDMLIRYSHNHTDILKWGKK